MKRKRLLYGEFVEELPSVDAGGCKFQCYTSRITTKKGAEYYRLFCKKTDKKCKPYISAIVPGAIVLSSTLKGELTEVIGGATNLIVWDDYAPIPSPVITEIKTLVRGFNGKPGGLNDENYQNYMLPTKDIHAVLNAIDILPLLHQIIKLSSMTLQKEMAEYREQLRQRLQPLAIKKIQVWQRSGELRIYLTIKDTISSGRFQVEEGQCTPETLVEAQTVLYVTGSAHEKPGAYKYLGGKCGGSRKYPVYAFPKTEIYNRESIEQALGFKLDSEEMLKLHTIYG